MIDPEIVKRVEANFIWDTRTYIVVDKKDLGPLLDAAKKGAEMEKYAQHLGWTSHFGECCKDPTRQGCTCGLAKLLEEK